MKRNPTLFLMLLACSLFSTALKAQLKTSFTVSSDTICSSVAEHFAGTVTGGTKPYHILWNFGDGDTSTNPSPSHIYAAGSYKVIFYALDAAFDTTSSSKSITVVAAPKPNLGPDQRGCWGHPILITTGLPHEPVVSWTWILGTDTQRNAFSRDTISVTDSGIYEVTVQNSAGCTGTGNINVYFNPPVKANRVDSTVCVGATVTIRAGSGGSGASYQWMDILHNNTIVATTSTYTFTANTASGFGVQADLAIVIKNTGHGVTCVDTGYYNIKVNTPTHPQLKAPHPACINDPAFQLVGGLVDVLHQGGNWIYPRKPSAIVNNFLYPNIMGVTSNDPTLGWIHYIYVDGFKCLTNDSVKISIYPLPTVSAGHDTEICIANGRYMLNNTYASPNGGAWYVGAGTPRTALVFSKNLDSVFFDPTVAGIKDTVYAVIYGYAEPVAPSCSNSDTVYIKVVHSPNPYWTMNYIGNEAYFHAQDSSVAGSAYHWHFGDGDTATGASPKHLYTSNKIYTVNLQVLLGSGCSNSFDSTINISKSGIKTLFADDYSVDVYPNPFSSSATVQYTINKSSKVTIALFDITGKQIAQVVDQTQAPGSYQAEINAGRYNLTPGVYVLKFMTEDGFVNRQIIKL